MVPYSQQLLTGTLFLTYEMEIYCILRYRVYRISTRYHYRYYWYIDVVRDVHRYDLGSRSSRTWFFLQS